MRDTFSPYMLVVLPYNPSTPPPLPPPKSNNNMPMLYYGLVVVGTAAAIFAIYNILLMKWCAHNSTTQRTNPPPRVPVRSSSLSSASTNTNFDNINLISSKFKYRKGGAGGGGGGGCGSSDQKDQGAASEYECVVCLSVFEEGEELRQLPTCKHSFHASCIDMWLYSHLDCPLCRSPVEPPVLCRSPLPVVVVVPPPPVVDRTVTVRVERNSREIFHNFSVFL